jgi:protein-S-isoprenylcysteine O-methyltransferase Ste14
MGVRCVRMSPFFRTLIFTMVVPGFWTVALPYWLLPHNARPKVHGFLGYLSISLIIAGTVLYVDTAFWGFAMRGKGTPAPIDPPKKLVVEGPYRVVRNPMYCAVALVIVGEAAMFRSVALLELAVCLFAAAALFVSLYEEPALRRKFGAEYDEYCRRVPRWAPRLKSK